MTLDKQKLIKGDNMTDEIQFKYLPVGETPASDDSGWIKDDDGNIIGYKNVRYMTKEDVQENFPRR